jgi:hypothetical protein
MSWAETLEVPRLSQGRVEIEVGVQIVNPRRCGSWGNCAAIELKSTNSRSRQASWPDSLVITRLERSQRLPRFFETASFWATWPTGSLGSQ